MSAAALRCAALITAVVGALSSRALAQPYAPGLHFRTLATEHFRVHYHQGEDALARRVAAAAERAHALLVPALAAAPRGGTEIVLSDDSDEANGSATPLPYNTIRLFAVPPAPLSELNDERDWVEALVTHEYVHVLHLDTVEGVPRDFNAVFGKVWTPSGFAPPLLVEGLAVLHEGDAECGVDGGRNENALFDMYARAVALEGPFPRLDEVVAQPLLWPRGSLAYLLGGRFWAFLRDRSGDEAVAAFVRDQGSRLWPYRFDDLLEQHFGADFPELWRAFGESLRARAIAELEEVRRAPVTAAAPLTRRGSTVLHPRWLPGGRGLVYFDAGAEERPGLRRVSREGRDEGRVADVEGNGTLAVRSDREAVVAATDVWREFATYDDLRLVDLATGRWRGLTDGERATDPDIGPDGETVVYAAHLPGGEMALRRLHLGGGPIETVFHAPGVQVASPRVSPDGRRIAFEIQVNGRRDVALWEDGRVAFVTDDDAIDLGPSWSPDGKTLFFSSERSGVYNLYAFDVGGPDATATPTATPTATATSERAHVPGRLWQVTNLELGAFEPQVSPDGSALAFVSYSRRGYDLAAIPLDRSAWREPAPPRSRPLRGPDAPSPPAAPALPDRPYRALDTAWPTFWLPTIGIDGGGATLGLLTGGSDVLLRHVYVAQAWYGVASREPGYDVAYVGSWLYPRLTLASYRDIGTTPGSPEFLEEEWAPLSASLTFTDTHLDRMSALTLGWRALRIRSLGGVPVIDEPGVAPYRNGTASEWSARLVFSDARRFVSSISPEEGRLAALTLRGADEALGGNFTYAIGHASLTQYLHLGGHVALALRGALGLARGTIGGRQPFKLGGVPSPDVVGLALQPLLGTIVVPGDTLRGYPSDALSGSTVENANVELRFPLAVLERGYRAWPVQLRRLHGALFLDTGNAIPAPPSGGSGFGSLRDLRFGAGAELRAETVLGYYLRTDLRLGIARGLGQLLAPWSGGRPPADPLAITQVYVTIGPSF